MKLKRIIPCLLLRNNGLVKTVRFKESVYIGDPINAVRIFNEKEADELTFLDIDASRKKQEPPYKVIANIASECFMPFSYGGGIENAAQVEKIIKSGAEKIIINTSAFLSKGLVGELARQFGSSTVVVSIDVRKKLFDGYTVFIKGGTMSTGRNPVDYAREMEAEGAGEILLNSIDRDGTMEGYDLDMIKKVSDAVRIPVIACGGAGRLADFSAAVKNGASAAAAGSMFVFHGKRRAVLITYPSQGDIERLFNGEGNEG